MSDITKHIWFDEDIEETDKYQGRVILRLCDELIGEIELSEQDSIALAKHYGHYKEPEIVGKS